MSDYSFMKKMSGEDAYLFKRCIRKMLDSTFIVYDKDEKLYEFIASESNQYDVNTYLAAIGYKVVVDERMKVAMLKQADEDTETVGLKRLNLYRFDGKQIRLLMVLWALFLERMGYSDSVYVTVGDIVDKCKIYQINIKPSDFKDAFRVFKRFSLIDHGDDVGTEESRVRLYPTLLFCMDVGGLKQVMAEYTGTEADPGELNPEEMGLEGMDLEETDLEEEDLEEENPGRYMESEDADE